MSLYTASRLEPQQKEEFRQLTATLLRLRFEHRSRSLKDTTQLRKTRRQRARLLTHAHSPSIV